MKRQVLMVVAHDGFRDEEYLEPRAELEAAGIAVVVASSQAGPARGKFGTVAETDVVLDQVGAADYEGIVFVGGPGAYEYFENPAAHALARAFVEEGKVVGAICIAPAILAKAGLLRGRQATVFESEVQALEQGGARYLSNPVVVDGRIVTGNGPGAARQFGRELVRLLLP